MVRVKNKIYFSLAVVNYWRMGSFLSELCINASHFLWIKPPSRRNFTRQLITEHACRSYPLEAGHSQNIHVLYCPQIFEEKTSWPKNGVAWLKQARRRFGQENVKQAVDSARAARLFGTFLYRHGTSAAWNFLNSRCLVDATPRRRFSLSFSKLSYGPWKFNFCPVDLHLERQRWNGL